MQASQASNNPEQSTSVYQLIEKAYQMESVSSKHPQTAAAT